jgi:hypothetical protein
VEGQKYCWDWGIGKGKASYICFLVLTLLCGTFSLKTQMAPTYAERKVGHRGTVSIFEDAAKSDPKDHLAEFFLALQLAMGSDWIVEFRGRIDF